MNAVNSNPGDKISDDNIPDDEISGFSKTTKFLTTKSQATKFPPPIIAYLVEYSHISARNR